MQQQLLSLEIQNSPIKQGARKDISKAVDDDKSSIDFKDFLSNFLTKSTKQTKLETKTKKANTNNFDTSTKPLINDILNLVAFLKTDGLKGTFPTDNKELSKILQNEQALNDFRNAKGLKDIILTAKKYGIEIKEFDFKKIQSETNGKEDFQVLFSSQSKLSKDKIMLSSLSNKNLTKNNHIKTDDKNLLNSIINSDKIKNTKTSQLQFALHLKADTNNNDIKKRTKAKIDKKSLKITPKNEIKESNLYEKGKGIDKIIKNLQTNHKQKQKTSNTKIDLSNKYTTLDKSKIKKKSPSLKVDNLEMFQASSKLQTDTKNTKIDISQSINRFANDLKEQIENYKPPIMKIKMTLSPKDLGDVNVNLISRGNSLQVTINSNSNTMALFTQNQAEFKNALVNMGFTDLNMSFSSNSNQNKEQQHSSKHNSKPLEEFSEDELMQIDTIELTIPKYT